MTANCFRVASAMRAKPQLGRQHCQRASRLLPNLKPAAAFAQLTECTPPQNHGLTIGNQERRIARREMIGGTLRYDLAKQRIFRSG